MAAPLGNQNAVKLTTDELKKEAYRQYCEYIASGKSKEGWKFKHPDLCLTYKTIEKYIRDNEVDFPSIHKEMAESDSFAIWELKGINMMEDKTFKSEPALYQMFMRNKFGWDKKEKEEDSNKPSEGLQFAISKGKNVDDNYRDQPEATESPSGSDRKD